MNKDKRIGIIGAAGTGKSSLAEVLALKLEIPNLKSREITESILRRDSYDYGSGIQIERFLANTGRQNEILRRTIEQQIVTSFVTDRTVVDLAAYAVCEMHHSDSVALKHIIETCHRNVSVYTDLFVCPWRDETIADTGKRTLNPWYQYLIHVAELGILRDWNCNFIVLQEQSTENRIQEILKIMGRRYDTDTDY